MKNFKIEKTVRKFKIVKNSNSFYIFYYIKKYLFIIAIFNKIVYNKSKECKESKKRGVLVWN